MPIRVGVLVVVVLASASPSHADVDPRTRATELGEIAKRRMNDNDNAGASEAFLEAYELTKELPYLINTAVTARKASQPHHAVLMFQRCLAEGGAALTETMATQIRGDIEAITRESVQVRIRTAGAPAEIELHKRSAGIASKATPLLVLLSTNASMSQTLRAKRDGYEEVTADIADLRPGAVMEREMEPRRKEGTLVVESVPAHASISVAKQTGTSIAKFVLPSGDYQVTATLPGYNPAYASVPIRTGEMRSIKMHLTESWWTRHRIKIYVGSAVLVAASAGFGVYKLFEPDYGKVINFPPD